ncbi:hypothetical protein C6496_11560 [Candidatus Poribacteria bacterium]|nr:MAG: hypothetical protein C6496_11560 [Candidatus Poribacteria bacterium]
MVKLTVCLFIFAMFTGCGGQLQQLAVETMENAQIALTSANAMGAETVAVTSLRTAEEMLISAGDAMNAGDAEQAYRLALRAYLHARIATETAIAVREEARVGDAQEQLAVSEQRVAEALQRLETIKAELEALEKM